MPTLRKRYDGLFTESKRVVVGKDGEPIVKQVTCCCSAPAASRRECADAAGNKTPCRCYCHSTQPPKGE